MTKTRPGLCPRRCLNFGPWKSEPTVTDSWQAREQFANGIVAEHCNHCGSLHPEVLLEGLRIGKFGLGGSDKNYKWYVDMYLSEGQIAAERERWAAGPVAKALAETAPDDLERVWQMQILPSASKTSVSKFYTPHLNRAQCEEILAMWTAKTLKHTLYVQPWLPAMGQDAPQWLVDGLGQ